MAKIRLNKVNKVKHSAHIKTTEEESSESEKKAYDSVKHKVKIDGFRKGKVPEHIVKSKYAGEIAEKTFQILLELSAEQLMQDHKLSIFKITKIENVKPDPQGYSFDLNFDIYPVVEVGKWKNYTIKEDIAIIKASDIEKEIKEIQKSFAVTEIKKPEDSASEGDLVTLRIERWSDGAPVGQPQEAVQVILGEAQLPPELEKKIISNKSKVNDEIKHTEEVEQGKDDKGNIQKIKVDTIATVQAIFNVTLPELTEELIQQYNPESKNLKDLKENLTEMMENRFHRKNMAEETSRVIEEIIEKADVEFPEGYLDSEFKKYMQENTQFVDSVPEDKRTEIRDYFDKEQRRKIVNDKVMQQAMEGLGEYKVGFLSYVKENFDQKTAGVVESLYADVIEENNKSEQSVQMMDGFLRYYHIYLLEKYFRGQGIVKKNKKIEYAEYFSQ